MRDGTVKHFTDLVTWQEAHKLVIAIYKLTKAFPVEERYTLIDQMRRCTISVTSNIAEGFSRQSYKEKAQFYYTAKGSLTELENQLLIAKDIHYISQKAYSEVKICLDYFGRLLTGLIRSTKRL